MLEDNFIKDSQMISFLEKVQQQLTIDDLDNDLDFFINIININCRCHFYKTFKGMAIAIRLLPDKIPSLDVLGLPESIKLLTDIKSTPYFEQYSLAKYFSLSSDSSEKKMISAEFVT